MANDNGVQPGWYADPLGRFDLRFFNGETWTADVSASGDRFVDPLGLEVGTYEADPLAAAGTNTAASAAMVLGIIAVSIAWMPVIVVFGAVAAVVALALGAVGLRRSQHSGVGRSRSIVGLVTGGCGLAASALGVVLTVIVVNAYDDYVNPAAHEVTIDSCTMVGSRVTASATLTNLDDSGGDFSILVGFVRPGTDNVDRESRVEVDDVAPGQSTEFTVERQVTLDEVDCIVIEVNGPLPFGLTLD